MNEPSDDDLADRVAELEDTLEELREELEPSRGPFGLPRPPSPREIIRFTDEYAIPTAIAILEANIRTLQLLRAVLRGARGAPRGEEVRDRASSLGRTTAESVDRALADLQAAIEGADLPQDDEARSLLEEAKGLNREIRDRLADANRADSDDAPRGIGDEPGGTDVPADPAGSDGGTGAEEEPSVEIDVDAELASIKDELDESDADGNGADRDRHGNQGEPDGGDGAGDDE